MTTPLRVSCHQHPLVFIRADNGWACDGRNMTGGCVKGCTGFRQTAGWSRFRCDNCDFDLCEGCIDKYMPSEKVNVTCHPHPLQRNYSDNGWACDGRQLSGGCKKGCTGFRQSAGWKRYRCNRCDFDLCEECIVTYSSASSRVTPPSNANSRPSLPPVAARTVSVAVAAPPAAITTPTPTPTPTITSIISGPCESPFGIRAGSAGTEALQTEIEALKLELRQLKGDATALKSLKLLDLEYLKATLQTGLEVVEAKIQDIKRRENDGALCLLCLSEPKNILLLPCRHLCLCKDCSLHPKLTACPVCRQNIQNKMDIFT